MRLNSSNRKHRILVCFFAMIMTVMLLSNGRYEHVYADNDVLQATNDFDFVLSDVVVSIPQEINSVAIDFAKSIRLSVRVEQDNVEFAELRKVWQEEAEAARKAAEQAAQQYSAPTVGVSSGNGAYVGRWVIPSTGVDVACYASNSQATVDAWDSAAYYRGYGHMIIGDHKNQGFNAIKSCEVGTKAYLDTPNGIVGYKCVGKMTGHNTTEALTDDNYNRIDSIYPGTLVCYTCNDNWRNVTLVFFAPDDGVDYHVDKDTGEIIDPSEMSDEWKYSNVPVCEVHTWREWEVVEESRVDYPGTKRRVCDVCGEREYGTIPKLEPDEPVETEPTETESVGTEPSVIEPSESGEDETVPDIIEPTESTDMTVSIESTESVTEPSGESADLWIDDKDAVDAFRNRDVIFRQS